jgi:CRISPR/Cas system-associated endonuclease Cas1
MSVTPIRPDTCQEFNRIKGTSEHAERLELARAFFSRDVSNAELESVRRERDQAKLRIVELEAELRGLYRLKERSERYALDTGRIQGMIACSCFVAAGLAIASIWAF